LKLGTLLGELSADDLERLAAEHVPADQRPSRGVLCAMLESTLSSYGTVQQLVLARQPPAFAILVALLEAPEHAAAAAGYREAVEAETNRLCTLVRERDILWRDDSLRLYRRVLYEARRSDLDINADEASILGVVRRELGIALVEHYLIQHHPDLREFWDKEHAFLHELNALRSAGVVFATAGRLLLADEVAPLVRQSLGIDMHRSGARRLFSMLPSAELAQALERIRAKTGGSKEERIERLLENWLQPRAVLEHLQIGALRELCKEVGASPYGPKDGLIDRLVGHIGAGLDQASEEASSAEAPKPAEPKILDHDRFRSCFTFLTGHQLVTILSAFNLRSSGTKDVRVSNLWTAGFSEHTLLGALTNRDLEELLYRTSLRLGGSKPDRIRRIVDHFATTDLELQATPAPEGSGPDSQTVNPAGADGSVEDGNEGS
jgi:hypothetical protein